MACKGELPAHIGGAHVDGIVALADMRARVHENQQVSYATASFTLGGMVVHKNLSDAF